MKQMFHFWFLALRGRASRKEFWLFFLLNVTILNVLFVVDKFCIDPLDMGEVGVWVESILTGKSLPFINHYYEMHPEEARGLGVLPSIFGMLLFIPSISVVVRRLHDLNLHGLFYLPTMIPIIGWFWWIVIGCIKGTDGENKYGEPEAYED